MTTLLSIILFFISLAFLKLGFGSLKDSSNHAEYGVESQTLHKRFSWVFIIAGAILAILAVTLFLK